MFRIDLESHGRRDPNLGQTTCMSFQITDIKLCSFDDLRYRYRGLSAGKTYWTKCSAEETQLDADFSDCDLFSCLSVEDKCLLALRCFIWTILSFKFSSS